MVAGLVRDKNMTAKSKQIPADKQVWNAVGKTVFNNNMSFVNGKLNLLISNSVPGLYLLQMTSDAGNSFTRKFVVE